MTNPTQQETLKPLHRREGEGPASTSEKDTTIMTQTTDHVTSDNAWKRELVYSTPGVFRPEDVLGSLRKVTSPDEAKAIIERATPTYAAPAAAPLPVWATEAGPWCWADGEWQRFAEKPRALKPGSGFTVAVVEYAHADGTITRTTPCLDVSIPGEDIQKPSDATALATLATSASMDLRLAMSAWKDELVASIPGLADPAKTRATIEGITDPEFAERFARQDVPAIPMPETIEAPAWAEEVGDWKWLGGADQQWQRRFAKTVDVPGADGQGICLYAWQSADSRGVRTEAPTVFIDVQADEVTNLRELAAWFATAVETIETSAAA